MDFVAYARALGVSAERVATSEQWREFELQAFLDTPGPAVLDIWIDRTVEPPIADRARVLGQSESKVDGADARVDAR